MFFRRVGHLMKPGTRSRVLHRVSERPPEEAVGPAPESSNNFGAAIRAVLDPGWLLMA
jgi:hypothetical protein